MHVCNLSFVNIILLLLNQTNANIICKKMLFTLYFKLERITFKIQLTSININKNLKNIQITVKWENYPKGTYGVSYFVFLTISRKRNRSLTLLHILYWRYFYVWYNASINHEAITFSIKYRCVRWIRFCGLSFQERNLFCCTLDSIHLLFHVKWHSYDYHFI